MRGDRVPSPGDRFPGRRGIPLIKGNGMKKALLCATAAATMVSVGATAHAQTGWYGTAKVGAIVDGLQDIDNSTGNNGAIDERASPEVDAVYGAGLGYGFGNGLRLEGAVGYRNVEMEVPDSFIGVQPPGTFGPDGAGSTRVTTLMANLIKDFNTGGRVMPYLGVGVGAARVDSRAASLYGAGGVQANGFDDSDTSFAYNVLAGFGIRMSEQLTADISLSTASSASTSRPTTTTR
jgi:OOP family OmpA-OmpF porin